MCTWSTEEKMYMKEKPNGKSIKHFSYTYTLFYTKSNEKLLKTYNIQIHSAHTINI